jgi:hypothetical protein
LIPAHHCVASQAVRRSEKVPLILAERPANGGLLRTSHQSPGSDFGHSQREIADSLRRTFEKFPFFGDCVRRLGSICTTRAKLTWSDAPFWAPHLFSEPSFRLSRGPKRSPSLNFTRVRRAGVVEGLSCYLPMRFVSIRKPHVHHERIRVVGAFDPIRARLWFQSHRDKSHFPNYPVVAKNLRLEGTSAFRSRRRRMIALRGLNRTRAHSFPEIKVLVLAARCRLLRVGHAAPRVYGSHRRGSMASRGTRAATEGLAHRVARAHATHACHVERAP